MIDLADDWRSGPSGPVELSPAEIAAAEAEWNAPPAWGRSRPQPPIPPVPTEHVEFLGRIAVLINEGLIAAHSIERVDARLLWVAAVRQEYAPGLVIRLQQACDALIAAGEVAANDWRIARLRAIKAEPSSFRRAGLV